MYSYQDGNNTSETRKSWFEEQLEEFEYQLAQVLNMILQSIDASNKIAILHRKHSIPSLIGME